MCGTKCRVPGTDQSSVSRGLGGIGRFGGWFPCAAEMKGLRCGSPAGQGAPGWRCGSWSRAGWDTLAPSRTREIKLSQHMGNHSSVHCTSYVSQDHPLLMAVAPPPTCAGRPLFWTESSYDQGLGLARSTMMSVWGPGTPIAKNSTKSKKWKETGNSWKVDNVSLFFFISKKW